jgi:capsular exopolysaccharide synthesis family protein
MARSVMVTSASPGEGKSFCSANLAVLQANKGYRTLLVDADFCEPRMAEIFVDPLRGQADQGSSVTQNLCQETIFKDLFLMSCERYTSKTGEPMKGEIFAKMLQDAYQAFDCVIVDTSPLNVISDGLDYSRHADAVVLVVKSGETKVDAARRSMRELQRIRANLVGCVLNSCDEINKDQLD